MKIDIVYTWVDDSQPGYRNQLQRYASLPIDSNPNRTRDNLDILKYSLRSVEQYLDWHGDIYLFTCKPQIPSWIALDNPKLHVIHHDDVIRQDYLPTFNSFCIVSHLHEIKGLSDRFLYIEDDMLFGNHTTQGDFISSICDKHLVYPRITPTTPAGMKDVAKQSPWDMTQAYCNHLLNESFGEKRRCSINRIPLLIEKKSWNEMIEKWSDGFMHTRNSRFRSLYNIAPEYLYPYYMLYTGRAKMTRLRQTYRKTFYLGLENNRLLALAGLALLRRIRPSMYCLNDNFGDEPDQYVVSITRKFLEEYYPDKSSFEI